MASLWLHGLLLMWRFSLHNYSNWIWPTSCPSVTFEILLNDTIHRVNLEAAGIWLCVGLFMTNFLWLKVEIFTTILATTMCYHDGKFCYLFEIHRIVRRHQTQIRNQQQQGNHGDIFRLKRLKKSIVNTFLFFIFLTCCYVPQMSVYLTARYFSTVYFATSTTSFS